jgi:hypothetical protein
MTEQTNVRRTRRTAGDKEATEVAPAPAVTKGEAITTTAPVEDEKPKSPKEIVEVFGVTFGILRN